MSVSAEQVLSALRSVKLTTGEDIVTKDLVRALTISGARVQFVIEAESPEQARALENVRQSAESVVRDLQGVEQVAVALTAHGPQQKSEPQKVAKGAAPQLKVGRHPEPQAGPQAVAGVDRIIAIGSGKGGVGKSTVSSNLAVALARAGRRVGLLDADIYGPSQPRMMGVSSKPASPDGKTIIPLQSHGVTMMSIGLMVDPDQAVVWRGPMLMGALQQMLGQVQWGELDVLLVDLPPGTGDVQLTLCQKTQLTGAIVVSTPQDVAMLDARKALDMFRKLGTPVLGLVENMSMYVCPKCGNEDHIFGHGGVAEEARKLGMPFLGELPLNVDVRLAGDAGTPIAATDSPLGKPYADLARRLIDGGMG